MTVIIIGNIISAWLRVMHVWLAAILTVYFPCSHTSDEVCDGGKGMLITGELTQVCRAVKLRVPAGLGPC